MNDTLIDLYRGVQGRRGEWRAFDRAYYQGEIVTITCNIGDIKHEDKSRLHDGIEVEHPDDTLSWLDSDDPDLLWLPPVYSDDERCLWKMVDWGRFDVQVEDAGYVMVSSFSNVPWGHPICAPRPLPEALLRAIREQEAK